MDGYPETFDINGKLLFGFGAGSDRYESLLQNSCPSSIHCCRGSIADELKTKGYAEQPHQREEDREGSSCAGSSSGEGPAAVHTAADVPVSAYSSTSRAYRLFYGVQENTDVFFKLMRGALGGFK